MSAGTSDLMHTEPVTPTPSSSEEKPEQRDDVLVVESVTMRYPGRSRNKRRPAIDDLSLRMKRGEIMALLGRNGAGKSTLIRMICTLTIPTEGRILVAGNDVVAAGDAARRILGVVVGGERSVYWKLTGRQNLKFFSALRGLRGRAAAEAIDRTMAIVGLTDRADDYAENYSTGMRQRLVIARALIGNPRVIVMDEPTAGLDPHAAASLQELIVELRDAGHAILVATHHIEEAEYVADRVAIVDSGRLVAVDTPKALRDTLGARDTLTCALQPPSGDSVERFLEGFEVPLTVLTHQESDDDRLELTLAGQFSDSLVARFTTYTLEQGWSLHSLRLEPVTLRHTFLGLTGHEIDEDEPEGEADEDD